MQTNKIYEGNCLEVLKTFPDKSINCVITSPPYWQLRDYGWTGQWGLEPTFKMYLENLWLLMDEIFRVLTDDGTVWINLGDTYSKDGTSGGNAPKISTAQAINRPKNEVKNKCLLLIPHRFAIGCIDRGWIVRNDIVWAKRNGMPESVTDRFSKKHEYFFFMVKSEKYYFDLDGVRGKQKETSLQRYQYDFTGQEGGHSNNFKGVKMRDKSKEKYGSAFLSPLGSGARPENNVNGKNPGSVSDFWDIPTQPSKDSHYATYNTKLIDKPIIAGCPKGGIILDPFCGTATTGCRAIDLDRQFIGVEGNPDYVNIGNKNLYPFRVTQKLF